MNSVLKYLFYTALNWAFHSTDLWIYIVNCWVTWYQHSAYFFLKTWKFGNWTMQTEFITCINIVYRWKSLELSWWLTMKFINENVYSHGRDKTTFSSSRSHHEFLGFELGIILTSFLYSSFLKCKLNYTRIIPCSIIDWI